MTAKCSKDIASCLLQKLTTYGETNFMDSDILFPPANQFCEICAMIPILLLEEEEMLLQHGLKIQLTDYNPNIMNDVKTREITWEIYSEKDHIICIIICLVLMFDDFNSSVSFELITKQDKIEFKKIKET
jgi:hypothetical protein